MKLTTKHEATNVSLMQHNYVLFFVLFCFDSTVFTRVSSRSAHLILGSERRALIQGRRSL